MMIFLKRKPLACWLSLLAIGVTTLHASSSRPSSALSAQTPASSAQGVVESPIPNQVTDPFGKDLKAFIASARNAEKLADPLQRCIAYPDPPGSHWTKAAVVAYCKYHFQPVITFAEVKSLIEHGKAAELDRRMDEALKAQMTQPDARGRLDQTFAVDFNNGSFATRSLLDAWKRDSPSSAYAYAASGYAYVAMAHKQRGGAFARDTPQENFDAMNRLLQRADSDLQHAISLNPHITPAYRAMIHAGALGFGKAYTKRAIDQALRADPSNWSIYRETMLQMEPQWLGSLNVMQSWADSAVRHANENPLLWIEKMAVARYQANVKGCNCAPPPRAAHFPAALDELAPVDVLFGAGTTAAAQGWPAIAVVYLSETIRFEPDMALFRKQRAPQLALVGEPQVALDESNELLKADPHDAQSYQARGSVYIYMGNTPRGLQDLETALTMNPDNDQVLSMLGDIYTHQTHQWDKAWDITDRIIRKYPGSPAGWVMRATIQEMQPREGLENTYQYFLAHFSGDPQMQWQIDHMRQLLANTRRTGATASLPAH
jgi:tetratricopeptide (TPR) repeat protein